MADRDCGDKTPHNAHTWPEIIVVNGVEMTRWVYCPGNRK